MLMGREQGGKEKGEKKKKTHTTQFEHFLVLPSRLPGEHVSRSLLLLPGSFSV